MEYPWGCKELDMTDQPALCFTVVLGFPGSSAAKESAYNVGDPASIPGLKIL